MAEAQALADREPSDKEIRLVIGASSAGTIFEWYDFFIYGTLAGLIGAGGHLLLVRAYERANASTLAPYTYAHTVAALCTGWLVFGTFPDRPALLGMALIVATGVAMAVARR